MTTYPVSVVIPAHNAGQTIKRAIDSAFAAGATEVIAVNDGSWDGTGIYINSLMNVYPSGRYKALHTGEYHRPPAGVCHARNMGLSAARCPVAIALDADDAFTPDGIRLLYEAYINAPISERVAVYGGHIKAESGEIVHAPAPERLAQKNLTGATYLFSVLDWHKADGYHPDFNIGCEDWAFMAALVSAGVKLIRIDEPVYIYSSGGKRAARCMKYADTIRQLLAEHYPTVFNATKSGA